ncbi:hypothetical protein K1719_009193 [Acacia pycnantha]|nr:hypothetical protein K1719_009193 [Acacia pycnantha]
METAYSIAFYVSHKNMNHKNHCSIYVPGRKVPKWFKYRAAHSSVIVEPHQISDLAEFFFCPVIGSHSVIEHDIFLKCTCYREGFEVARSERRVNVRTKSDHVYIWNYVCELEWVIIIRGNQQLFTNIKFCFEFTAETNDLSKSLIIECGVCPVYVSESQKFIQQMEMERKRKWPQDIEEQQPLPQFEKIQVLMKQILPSLGK